MHSFYLRTLYVHNQLAKGEMELSGQLLSLADVKNDTYLVGAVNDHIVPWPSSYKATGLLGGSVRYVLSSGGHIAGIVNPPGPKAWYEVAQRNPDDAARWREAADRHTGSWWQDGPSGAEERPGRFGQPPPRGGEGFPALTEAQAD